MSACSSGAPSASAIAAGEPELEGLSPVEADAWAAVLAAGVASSPARPGPAPGPEPQQDQDTEQHHAQDDVHEPRDDDRPTPVPTGWPQESAPKRYHLDFYVEDLDKGEQEALALGATKVVDQPNAERWRVLLDPGGHPFDLCLKS